MPTPEETANQARAHALAGSLTTMEEFLSQEQKVFITAYEPVYRAMSDESARFDEKIVLIQSAVDSGELNDLEKADLGYELTRFIVLVDDRRRSKDLTVVFYEGELTGVTGYGVLRIDKLSTVGERRVIEMEVFTSPQHLLEVHGDDVVLTAARVINDRNDLTGYNAIL